MSTLIIIAKAPVPGRVKTRLTPPFTPREAASLAKAALEDTLGAVSAVGRTGATTRLLVLDGDPALVRIPPGFTVLPQVPGSLDRRLAAAFQQAAKAGAGPAFLVGMDTPQITPALLADSLPTEHEDAVLGLADDGGFWGIGFTRPRALRLDRLLHDVPMSTAETGAVQLARLRGAGLRVRLLPTLRDVDAVADAEHVAMAALASRFARTLRSLHAPAGVLPLPAAGQHPHPNAATTPTGAPA